MPFIKNHTFEHRLVSSLEAPEQGKAQGCLFPSQNQIQTSNQQRNVENRISQMIIKEIKTK